MNIFKIYFFLGAIVLAACSPEQKNKTYRLVKKTVFVLEDPKELTVSLPVSADTSYLEHVFEQYNLVDIRSLDSSIHVDLKYADTSNFLHRAFYDGLNKAYFPCPVAIRICNAQFFLKAVNPSLSLLILDAARPVHIQQMMWDSLAMPPDLKYKYLAPPYSISLHNYGCAVDITIVDESTGKNLDMGTEFDHFGKLAEPAYEWQFLKSGELSREAHENRKLLRKVMQAARLNPITSEWWHFNFCTREYAAANFPLIK